MTLTILRGLHNIHMADDVIRICKEQEAQIVLFEMIATSDVKQSWRICLQRIATEESFANQGDMQGFIKSGPEPYYRIAWELRNLNPRYDFVDRTLPAETASSELTADYNIFNDDVFHCFDTADDLSDFYDRVRQRVENAVTEILDRDTLVATQVSQVIAFCQAHDIAHEKIVLVQGYVHHSAPQIHTTLPGLQITEKFYNSKQIPLLNEHPGTRLILYKLDHPTHLLPNTLIAQSFLISIDDIDNTDDNLDDTKRILQIQNDVDETVYSSRIGLYGSMPDEKILSLVEKIQEKLQNANLAIYDMLDTKTLQDIVHSATDEV